MISPLTLPPLVAKLLPRLASPHDGEVVATARALGRVLTGAGLDFHALAARLTLPVPVYPTFEPASRSKKRSRKPKARPAAPTRDSFDGLAAATFCAARSDKLQPREQDFVSSILDQLKASRTLTDRQASWLRDIHDRLRAGER